MNIFSIDEFKVQAKKALEGTGAFIRVSKGEGLLVTDAVRRGCTLEELRNKLPGFQFFEKDSLVYLTPEYGFSAETNDLLTEILKADKLKREKLIRNGLAVAMRLKNREQIEVLKILFERMI